MTEINLFYIYYQEIKMLIVTKDEKHGEQEFQLNLMTEQSHIKDAFQLSLSKSNGTGLESAASVHRCSKYWLPYFFKPELEILY